jgi:hypothetical protein
MIFRMLSHEEQCLMINAAEHDLLPSVIWDWRADLDFGERLRRFPELAAALIGLVDRGAIEVRRFAGGDDYEVVGRAGLEAVLAEPAVGQYDDHTWIHRDRGLAIVETPAWHAGKRNAVPQEDA